MQDYEKLGVFYLGRQYDLAAGRAIEAPLLYDAKDLTTHGLCVGMTGSGKTGLCLALLEEAAIDGIPAIAIDPKGDLGNLLLTFPDLQPADFEPWIEPGEATRAGMTVPQLAEKTAALWRQGLADWGQGPERIARLRSTAEIVIYTPGSNSGLPLSLLRSMDAPPVAVRDHAEALRDRVLTAVSGLLALLGIDADPLRSREHILLSNVLERAWREGRSLDMAALIREIQQPAFKSIGVMDLETVFPAADRFGLSMQLNNLLASPGFAAWSEGEPLDVGKLLHTADGKPRLSILSIAHLSDSQRMFFVTTLLNETIGWMRSQTGTSSLRALLYMDEVFGYFPPTANPPSKLPMLTLLKQARAFGLGVVLATQNPVDLDYKGLANCGTWFLGRLQTERDKARVLDGLEGATSAAGKQFDRSNMERILSGLGNRVFLMNNVHDDEPTVFQTRWALSYLRGPLTRNQIETLMQPVKAGRPASPTGPSAPPAVVAQGTGGQRPILPPGIEELSLAIRRSPAAGDRVLYRPAILGLGKLHYVQASAGVDIWRSVALLAPVSDSLPDDVWAEAEVLDADQLALDGEPSPQATFAQLPSALTVAKNYASWKSALKNHLFRARPLGMYQCAALKQKSKPGESEAEFRIRLRQAAHEQRDLELEKLRKKYAPKLATLQDRLRRAQAAVDREKSQASQQTLQTALNFGTTLLGALFGRKMASTSNVTRAATSMRSASKIAKERADVGHAQESAEAVLQQQAAVEEELAAETERLRETLDDANLEVQEMPVPPRKSDMVIDKVALVWVPWIIDANGLSQPAN
jgi:hypothetical protein